MIVSDRMGPGLKLIGNPSSVTEENFVKLLEICISVIAGNEDTGSISQLYNSKVDSMKEAYAALLTLLVESARQDIDAEVLSNMLNQDFSFAPTRSEKLVKNYVQNRSKLQAALSSIGSHLPHIVDTSWTLDYCIKTNSLEHVGVLQYLVQFHVESCEEYIKPWKTVQKIKFLCSLEELQDLVGKLRDAVKHVERLAAV